MNPSSSANAANTTTSSSIHSNGNDNLVTMSSEQKYQSQEQENKWKLAFEKVVKENEQLRTRAGDAILVAQLRERYESCLKEKNELQEKIKIYDKVLRESSTSSSHLGQRSLEQAYIELRDEYKVG